MRKNFFKQLAFVLAATMVVGSSAPAASAAAKPALDRKTKNLYLNNEEVGDTYDFNIKNKVKGSSYKWTSSDTSVATVNSKNGLVTGKKVGKATISCKITLPTKKTQTLKATVTVKANATAVAVKNPVETVAIGENVYDFNRTLTESSATDKTAWFITDDTAGTTISSKGVVSTTNAGEFTLTAKTYQNKTEKAAENWTSVSEPITVKVVPTMTEATQTHSNKINLVFDDNMTEKLTKDELKIVSAEGVNQVINELTFSTDGKTVAVSTYSEFLNDATYKVSYEGKELEFVAKVGDVASVVLEGGAVQYGKETTVKYKLLDANNIDVTNGKESKVLLESTEGNISIDDKKITMYNIGDTAKVKAVFHSGNYTSAGQEIVVESPVVTFNSVEKLAITAKISAYTITDGNPDWDKTVVHTIAAENKDDNKIYVKGTNSNGEAIDSSDEDFEEDFKFYSSDETKLIVDEDGGIYPVAAGSVHVKVVYGDSTIMLPVTVGSKSTASSISVDKTSLTVSLSDKLDNEVGSATVKVLDQYGDEMDSDDAVEIECTGTPSSKVSKDTAKGYATVDVDNNKKVNFNIIDGMETGTYTFKLTYLKRSTTVKVSYKKPGTTVSYVKIELDKESVDTAYGDKDDFIQPMDIKLYSVDSSGVRIADVTSGAAIEVVGPDGKVFKMNASSNVDSDAKDVVTTGGAIAVHQVDGDDLVKAATGKYTVRVNGSKMNVESGNSGSILSKNVRTATLEVKDTQKAPSLRFKTNTVDRQDTVLDTVFEVIEVKSGKTVALLNDQADGLWVTDVEYKATTGSTSKGSDDKLGNGNDTFDKDSDVTINVTKVIVKEKKDDLVVKHTIKTSTAVKAKY